MPTLPVLCLLYLYCAYYTCIMPTMHVLCLFITTDFPPGTIVRLSESGYVNKDLFLEWLEHFCKHVKEREGKTLLVLDGHGSHTLNLDVLLYAAEHGVKIASMPPHTSHYLNHLTKCILSL